MSRRHARLELRSDAWWVVDQGSANGTYVNSLKVAETALKDGQELRFGALAFRVDIEEDPEATVASPILPEATETVMAAPTPDLSDTPPHAAARDTAAAPAVRGGDAAAPAARRGGRAGPARRSVSGAAHGRRASRRRRAAGPSSGSRSGAAAVSSSSCFSAACSGGAPT